MIRVGDKALFKSNEEFFSLGTLIFSCWDDDGRVDLTA